MLVTVYNDYELQEGPSELPHYLAGELALAIREDAEDAYVMYDSSPYVSLCGEEWQRQVAEMYGEIIPVPLQEVEKKLQVSGVEGGRIVTVCLCFTIFLID